MKTVYHPHGPYEGFIFFWITADHMSNWHHSVFKADDWVWDNSEQYFMYLKCACFGDTAGMEKCKVTTNPKAVKAIGRAIPGYDDAHWKGLREEAMYQANLAKYGQNERLKKQLLATDGYHLVEASPVDDVWGIKLDEDDPRSLKPEQWLGTNLLGICLEKVRNHFKGIHA
jgi:ribA/ribD-fused uncharacterized protein